MRLKLCKDHNRTVWISPISKKVYHLSTDGEECKSEYLVEGNLVRKVSDIIKEM